ncbi:helix-turn-helix transcriptional regulator [Streptomyces sp. NPDC051684]|uniref:helix-turn-helix transcriptional regulator n=1 Tax=Streptomyces sp. NPDC051684 TaxID=3365670 RepID=UPI0037A9FF2D
MTQPVSFSTLNLPEEQHIALWERHNAEALIGLTCRSLGEARLDATEINLQLPRVHVARVLGSPHIVERPQAVIRRTPSEAMACYLNLADDAFFYHDDGVHLLRSGQLIVCDADRPFVRGFSKGLEELAIKVPRPVWRDIGGPSTLRRPLVLDVDEGSVGARTFARLAGRALRPGGADTVDEQTLLGLLGSLVTGRPPALAAAHRAMAKVYIDRHLDEPGLSAPRVARGVGISERHLSRVFSSGGSSVPRYLLERRLELAYSLLSRGGTTTVAEAAVRCGFGSAAHFSHRFKERYGVRASDVLREARIAAG